MNIRTKRLPFCAHVEFASISAVRVSDQPRRCSNREREDESPTRLDGVQANWRTFPATGMWNIPWSKYGRVTDADAAPCLFGCGADLCTIDRAATSTADQR